MPVDKTYFESINDDDSFEEILNDKNSTPSKGIISSFSKRAFSFRKKKSCDSSVAVTPSPPPKEAPRDPTEEDDPVMAHFQSRSTQRVRFDLGTPTDKPDAKPKGPKSPAKSPTAIQRFMKGALFGKRQTREDDSKDFYQREAAKELEESKVVWHESKWERSKTSPGKSPAEHSDSSGSGDDGGDVVPQLPATLTFSLEERPTLAKVTKLLNKARRAIHVHYRYAYAVKCHVKALDLLDGFPRDHPTVVKTLEGLNQAHHLQSSFQNSANIVKMGIKSEDTGELVKALKMYSIAYRIRRDNLGRSHPSLIVLLNMLGSIQIKRGELDEAMEIYELALSDLTGPVLNTDEESPAPGSMRLMTRSVTYREMGSIYERWGDLDKALDMYHQSLQCIAQYKGLDAYLDTSEMETAEDPMRETITEIPVDTAEEDSGESKDDVVLEQQAILDDLDLVHMTRSYVKQTEVVHTDKGGDGMELLFGLQKKGKNKSKKVLMASNYDIFFPPSLESKISRKGLRRSPGAKNMATDFSDIDTALTLHRIAQLHRAKGEYNMALAAYEVSLRGMKYSLGKYHPNVAAILGNMGNLRKEMGDMDAAFETYQQVLAIESYRLGLSHPDVTVTLHNIATIDAARGNHEHALSLYKQVLSLQRKLFGEDDESLAVTSACMGDVYERMGEIDNATDSFEEALRIKMFTNGRHSLEVARLFHKLGKLSLTRGDYPLAEVCLSKAIMVYRMNDLTEDDEWVIDANRDSADIDAAIAMGRGITFEC